MKVTMRLTVAVCLMLLLALQASAALAAKSFVVLPFQVNAPQSYAYLGKALPATLQAKLTRPGQTEGRVGSTVATSSSQARGLLGGADYAIWGTIAVTGTECTVTLNSVDKGGKTWSKSQSGQVSVLTGTISSLSSALGSEVLGIGGSSPRTAGRNNDIIMNETGNQQSRTYLNPQFRYQGASESDGSRLRTQRIKEKMVDMAVGDFNGDGRNEVAVLTDHELMMFTWNTRNGLQPLGQMRLPSSNDTYSMRAIDLNRDRADDLVVATFDPDNNRPYTYFFSFKGNKFKEVAERVPYFASVMRLPPNYAPTLVGQRWDSVKLFAPGVHIMVRQGKTYELGGRISLPAGATVFNCVWMPASRSNPSEQLIMLTEDEKLKVFQGVGQSLIHTTMERYSGSSTGMDFYKSMPGLGVNKTYQLPSKFFAPMRLIAADIGHTGEYTLLINKPVSTAAQLFDRYRYFPQGEIHALYWDGVGLGLKWKTRRIRGSVAEIDLADVNNDGVLDLVVGINTSSDLGIGSRQSMITAYPLDVSKTDPNTPADLSDFEVNPN